MTDDRDDDPETLKWEAERQRLQLVTASAIRQLMSHTGCEDIYLPYEGEIVRIQKVNQANAR